MLKAVNFVRLLSILFFLITLSLVYAYLDPVVKLSIDADASTIHRTNFFYFGAALFFLINSFLWILLKIMAPLIEHKYGELSAGWFAALPVVVNFYICFLVGFLGVLNNPSNIQFSSYEYLNYLGPILLLVWGILIIYFMSTKKSI
jgi:hypothetical protein